MAGSDTSAADVHPNDDLLIALHDGVLFAGDRPLVEGHLKSCHRCRARLVALTEDITPAQTRSRAAGLGRRTALAIVLVSLAATAGIVGWRTWTRQTNESLADVSTTVINTIPDSAIANATPPAVVEPNVPSAASDATIATPAELSPAAAESAARPLPEPMEIASPNRNFRWRVVGLDVERTTNGGRDWRKQSVPLTKAIAGGAAPSAAVCWLVGRSGAVFVAVGSEWKDVSLTEMVDLVKVAAIDSTNATVTASDGRQFSTSDAGVSWTPLQ